jgi:dCMP deaminase
MGYNGVPSEKKHCIDYWKETRGDNYAETSNFLVDHHEWSLINELHAEMNAILQSEVSLKGTSLYTLYSPCIQCAKCIVSAKIKNVYYLYKYERDYEYTKTLLQKSEIGLCEVII